jgi:hypothetical protein
VELVGDKKMVRKYTLLRSQKRRIFDMLSEVGLEPADFSWSDKEELGGSILVSRLDYRQWGYYFQFTWYDLSSWCILCPGRYRSLEMEHPTSWDEQETIFRSWAQSLKGEIESPDPWAELAKYQIAFDGEQTEVVNNETISGYEAEQMADRLNRLAGELEKDLRLDERQAALLRGRLAYLAEAAKRQKSKDWLYTALGVCATLSMTLALDADPARKLWQQVTGQLREAAHVSTPKSRLFGWRK